MSKPNRIQVFEYHRLVVSEKYGADNIEFKKKHLDFLAKYLTQNQGCPFYTLYYDRVKFNQYVGVIQVEDLTIEVLPKTDKHTFSEDQWQQALIMMLQISLQVNARISTTAAINIKKLSVLEAYFLLFLKEVEILMHQGLIKKYRNNVGNLTSLKGKLLIHEHVTKNIIHAERFYVSHNIYDRNNVYNSAIRAALDCIQKLAASSIIRSKCSTILLDFPDCNSILVNEIFFNKLKYDRKTERYKTAIELAKIILLNYHPDLKGGNNNILAIMVDMNRLWENYIYFILKRACNGLDNKVLVYPQQKELFWLHPDKSNYRLKPDLILEGTYNSIERRFVLDTKWKYQSDTSIEDVRQMYAYNDYFDTKESYLLYPEKLNIDFVVKKNGNFYSPASKEVDKDKKCGLVYIDLLDNNGNLNLGIGNDIIKKLWD